MVDMSNYDHYYVNTKPQTDSEGEHEVHTGDCPKLPGTLSRKYLGYYDNCQEAVEKAKEHYDEVDGCAICSPDCHTR